MVFSWSLGVTTSIISDIALIGLLKEGTGASLQNALSLADIALQACMLELPKTTSARISKYMTFCSYRQ